MFSTVQLIWIRLSRIAWYDKQKQYLIVDVRSEKIWNSLGLIQNTIILQVSLCCSLDNEWTVFRNFLTNNGRNPKDWIRFFHDFVCGIRVILTFCHFDINQISTKGRTICYKQKVQMNVGGIRCIFSNSSTVQLCIENVRFWWGKCSSVLCMVQSSSAIKTYSGYWKYVPSLYTYSFS